MSSSVSQWTVVVFVASVILAGFAGYRAGQSSQLSTQFLLEKTGPPASTETHQDARKGQIEVESDEEALTDGDLASVHTKGPCKMAS